MHQQLLDLYNIFDAAVTVKNSAAHQRVIPETNTDKNLTSGLLRVKTIIASKKNPLPSPRVYVSTVEARMFKEATDSLISRWISARISWKKLSQKYGTGYLYTPLRNTPTIPELLNQESRMHGYHLHRYIQLANTVIYPITG